VINSISQPDVSEKEEEERRIKAREALQEEIKDLQVEEDDNQLPTASNALKSVETVQISDLKSGEALPLQPKHKESFINEYEEKNVKKAEPNKTTASQVSKST
jgi:hypothetical protein